MKIDDPVRFFGMDSGVRVLRTTSRESAVLLRAVEILERGYDLVEAFDRDRLVQDEEVAEALCLGPAAIRRLVEEGLTL